MGVNRECMESGVNGECMESGGERGVYGEWG